MKRHWLDSKLFAHSSLVVAKRSDFKWDFVQFKWSFELFVICDQFCVSLEMWSLWEGGLIREVYVTVCTVDSVVTLLGSYCGYFMPEVCNVTEWQVSKTQLLWT